MEPPLSTVHESDRHFYRLQRRGNGTDYPGITPCVYHVFPFHSYSTAGYKGYAKPVVSYTIVLVSLRSSIRLVTWGSLYSSYSIQIPIRHGRCS